MNEVSAPLPPAPADNRAPEDVRGLAIVSIAKAYDKRQVLQDVSLDVARGEVAELAEHLQADQLGKGRNAVQ